MPEARIVLAQAVTYVASAPKSNAAYPWQWTKHLPCSAESQRTAPVPTHLSDAHYKACREAWTTASDINMPTIIRTIM